MTSVELRGTGTTTRRVVRADPYEQATLLIAHLAVLSVGFDFVLVDGVSTTLVLGVLLAPIWISALPRFPFAKAISVLILVSVVVGYGLSILTSSDHSVSSSNRISSIALLLSGLTATGLLLWARTLMPLWRVVVLYGLGALASPLVAGNMSWKFDLAVPVTVLTLGLLERRNHRVLAALAAVGLGVLGVLDEGRGFFGFCVLSATLTLWQLRPRGNEGSSPNRWQPVLFMAGLGFALYLVASSLLVGGYLGETLKERSVAQVEATGSLLTGGRPEWSATRELMKLKPSGYGAGVVPTWTDLQAGRAGLASIRIDAGGYTTNYMFGGQFRLHSVAADLWVSFGWAGLALAGTIVVAMLSSLGARLARRRAPTSIILTSTMALWYVAFGPIYSNWIDVCAAVGLVLVARSTTGADRGVRRDADASALDPVGAR